MQDSLSQLMTKASYSIGAVVATVGGMSWEVFTFVAGVMMFAITWYTGFYFRQRQDRRNQAAEARAREAHEAAMRTSCEGCPVNFASGQNQKNIFSGPSQTKTNHG